MELNKCIKTLFFPYIILSLICYCYQLIIFPNAIEPFFENTVIQPYKKIILGQIGLPTIGSLWFLISLFTIRIVANRTFSRDHFIYICISISLIIAYFLHLFLKENVYAIFTSMLGYPFFAFGYLLKKNMIANLIKKPILVLICITLIMAIITYIIYSYNGGTNISMLSYGNNIFLFLIGGICGSFIIIPLSIILKNFNHYILKNYCLGMVVIIGLHYPLIDICRRIFNLYSFTMFYAIITTLSIMIILYPIIIFCKKYFPFIIGYRK